ncbi:MAG: N-formylglutamate amidohydrolase [Actinomycetota bacterium]|nr:N-formylglutamate amidohydrolase [Actinomycetota bacterium]
MFLIADKGTAVICAALHCGHELRPEVSSLMALDETQRLREEDPFTDTMADIGTSRMIAVRSRFEVDLNRPRDQAVYLDPAQAWGLDVWKAAPPFELAEESRRIYDSFYASARELLDAAVARHGAFVVFDIHSYNHRRDGAGSPSADAATDPEINLGTESVDRERFGGVVDGFISSLTHAGYDIRQNVKFRGGNFARWINATYPGVGCALAIEFKKTFMDEWTGHSDPDAIERARDALAAAAVAVAPLIAGGAR